MGGLPMQLVHEGSGVLRHFFNADPTSTRKTFANAAIVKNERLKVFFQSANLIAPRLANGADSLD
jgi:hypothetical protein